jgi:hypothetical protein
MKALSVKQPYANRILAGNKVIELRRWQTSYRGDLLICTRRTPADFLKKLPLIDSDGRYKVEDLDNETEDWVYFGKALCLVDLYEINPMIFRDELDTYTPKPENPFIWFLRNARPIKPFDVKCKPGLFEVNEPIVFLKKELHS